MTNIVCEGGVCRLVDMPETATAASDAALPLVARLAHGFMEPAEFLAFLNGADQTAAGALPSSLAILPFFLLLAGLAMNLTPCVLPMVPVNLIIIGRSWRRGVAYALGMVLSYGALGLAAALGGLAFGVIQGSAWFNAFVATVFAVLSLSMFGVFNIDFSRYRPMAEKSSVFSRRSSLLFPLFMGALCAVLAGACVAPVLVSVLLLTADLYARGESAALLLPFLVGGGMALPWPFLAAGLNVLPKPGAWMKVVNRIFGVVILGFACYYGFLAARGLFLKKSEETYVNVSVEATPSTISDKLRSAKRPVLVDCWATWCKNCSAMEERTLSTSAVRKALEKFTVIRLQAEDIGELKRQSGFENVKGLPAFLIFE
ncbi:MAG: thioredoxin family protein [Kiritimatiellae bacterium]|nr:thioredoxin family protein [Kiritimatiellia bacterium]